MRTSALPPRLLDAGALGLGLLGVWLAVGPTPAVLPTESPAWWWADLVGGLAGSVALLARRRYPVGLVVALTVLGIPLTSPWLAGTVASFGLAVRRPWPWAGLLSAGGLLLGLSTRWIRSETPTATSWGSLGYAVVISVAVVACGAAVRERHRHLDALLERAERAEGEAALRAEAARAGERTRIAREMHDVLGHRLSLVSMHAAALAHRRRRERGVSPGEVDEALEVIHGGTQEALNDLRGILGVLRGGEGGDGGESDPVLRAPQPTLADLDRLVADVRAAGTDVVLHDDLAGGAAAVPDECGRTLFRITQEALTNAARHAPGRPVDVHLRGRAGAHAELDVSNRLPPPATVPPPPSPPSPPSGGTGLVGIAERVELAGGRVLSCGPDGGSFRIAVRVPWPAEVAP